LHRRDHPSRDEYLDVDADATIESIIAPLGMPPALKRVFVPPDARGTTRVADGDALAIWPPIAGG
jgi:sulfur carrier protein ThiS